MNLANSPSPCRATVRGFTLTEVLVVIVIIVVIAAFSFTGLRRMRDYADKVNSTRNLSQLQIANTSYAADHSGRYASLYATDDNGARIGYWFQDPVFLSYLIGDVTNASGEPVRAVPSSHLDPKVYRARKNGYPSMAASYGMNETGLMAQTGPNVRAAHNMNRVRNPAGAMAFATATDYRVGYNSRFTGPELGRTTNGSIAYRHGGKALVAYFDGHVGEMSKADIKMIDETRGGRSNSFWTPTAR
jgi:prepilin-type N-terminal cleavage/methylation domain-containing protein/prepilin-type processing-associated H-X9-DG protein